MGIRDKEIQRIEKYAEGLGLKVKWETHKKGDPGATWERESQILTIYTWSRQSKVSIILLFLHELGHHMDWIYSGKITDKKVEDAYGDEAKRTSKKNPKLSKDRRKLIYDSECNGIQYMLIIAKELNLKLKESRILLEMEIDKWFYYHYYLTGNIPTRKQIISEYKKRDN